MSRTIQAVRTDYTDAVRSAAWWLAVHEAALTTPYYCHAPHTRSCEHALAALIAAFAGRERISIARAEEELRDDYLARTLRHYAAGGALLKRMGDHTQ